MKKVITILSLVGFFVILTAQTEEPTHSMTGSLGSVTIDGTIYNQISLRPEIPVGKFGVGLDIYLYIDADGNLYKENWDFSNGKATYRTLVDKIYYLRWGRPNDDFYFQFGALPYTTLGQGILVNNYSNTIDYPEVRRMGLDLKAKYSGLGLEVINSDFKRIPGVSGFRASYDILSNLQVGVSYVTDADQMSGLKDRDGDGYPDVFDHYPDIGEKWDEAEEEKDVWQNIYEELNGNSDGFEDWFSSLPLNHNPYDPSTSDANSISGTSIDVAYKINKNISLYSQVAQLVGKITDDDDSIKSLGMGFVPLGVSARFGPMKFRAEYRQTSDYFIFNYWDQSYDFDRIKYDSENEELITKESTLSNFKAMKGFYAEMSANMFNFCSIGIGYQDMRGENVDEEANKTLLGNLNINTSQIPKLKKAELFYKQSNISTLFTEESLLNTIWGYDVGLEISDGLMLVYKGRTSYIRNSDFEIEPVNSVQFETQFVF
ncbi:MAG: hypothetical protein ISR90_04790 [Candidatus Marinimicrobia bacterium]|nr:hypothetical protein [Candidatus Neomarinimicrobiota bacterium]MBL7023354.1 hypothetical protein [Candidatus Neomarinimicrobiota bacterium]MBL7109313.1 hypothetical protein [Candidatus Neomarinimicrobiota bacterium]